MARDRGIEFIEGYSGDFLDIISKRIKKKGKVRILEAGCGYGMAMIGFVKRFGDKVEMVGFNYSQKHGNLEIMKQKAVEKGIFTEEELSKIKNLPKFVYCDVDKRLPFANESFDFIYSKSAIYLFGDKVNFFLECNRLLKKDGLARLAPSWSGDMAPERNPKEYLWAWEIWDQGKRVDPWKYFNRFKGVKASKGCMEIRKVKNQDFKLKFVAKVDTNFIWKKFMGVKSIYTTQLDKDFKPHWKS